MLPQKAEKLEQHQILTLLLLLFGVFMKSCLIHKLEQTTKLLGFQLCPFEVMELTLRHPLVERAEWLLFSIEVAQRSKINSQLQVYGTSSMKTALDGLAEPKFQKNIEDYLPKLIWGQWRPTNL